MSGPPGTEIRRFDSRGEPLSGIHPGRTSVRHGAEPERVELPLPLWRRARPQANVIALRIPAWAPSSSKS
jgi:hypothetical protein